MGSGTGLRPFLWVLGLDLGLFGPLGGSGPGFWPFRGSWAWIPAISGGGRGYWPIISLNRPIFGILEWILAILGGLGPGLEQFEVVLNRPI